jgi:hypothetical protein
MAGDWIRMRTDLDEDPAVIGIAEMTSLDVDTVVGKLWKVWRWANNHTLDGNAAIVTKAWLDRYTSVTGFADALVKVGWLVVTDNGITIPKFYRYNGKSAKERAMTAQRVAKHRGKGDGKCNGITVTKPLPEKRREEKSIGDESPMTPLAPSRKNPASEQTASPTVLTYPCVGKGPKEWALTEAKLAEYAGAFPGIDALSECRKALQWVKDNPANAKTARGLPAFLGRWLGRAQDRIGGPAPANGHARAGPRNGRLSPDEFARLFREG